jgi:branched-chain amino acid transport system ATP-binding protein
MNMNTPLLRLERVTKNFGGLAAVSELDLELRGGEILGLVGPNGAGKTTVFNLISGVYRPNSGGIFLEGQDITGLKPHKIASKGVARTFQISTLFNKCTVLENVIIGHHIQMTVGLWGILWRSRSFAKEEREVDEKARELLAFLRLTRYARATAENLPLGHQHRLAIAIALSNNPTILLMDEPFAGMDPEETNDMMQVVRDVREKGISIILIEHDMKAVMGLSDRIVVINYGSKLAEGTPDEIQNNKEVIKAYLGRQDDLV